MTEQSNVVECEHCGGDVRLYVDPTQASDNVAAVKLRDAFEPTEHDAPPEMAVLYFCETACVGSYFTD